MRRTITKDNLLSLSQEDLIQNVSITKWQKLRRKCCVHQNQNSSDKKYIAGIVFFYHAPTIRHYIQGKKNILMKTVLLLQLLGKEMGFICCDNTTITIFYDHVSYRYNQQMEVHRVTELITVSDKNLDKLSWYDKNKRATYSFSTILQTFDEMETETAPTEEGATEENP